MTPTDVFTSLPGRVLTGAVALAALLAVAGLAGDVAVADLLLAACLGALAVLAVWATFGRPAVEVSDGGVVLRNVLRTVTLPWPTVLRTEVAWSLVVHTTGGAWTAWAAPRASGAARAVRRRAGHEAGTDADGAAAGSSGSDTDDAPRRHAATAQAVAASIDGRQARLVAAGHLDDARRVAEQAGIVPAVRWHVGTLATTAALVALAVLTRLA